MAIIRNDPRAFRVKTVAIALSAVALSGCATFSNDGGIDAVSAITKERIGQDVKQQRSDNDANAAQTSVSRLLANPLTPDTAVQVALLNNKGLQVSLVELGVAESELVQAGRMRNPSFSFGRISGGGETEINRSIMFDIVGLLTIPLRSNIERGRLEQAKLEAASRAVQLAADTRKAYFNAVAAQQSSQYAQQVVGSAEAGAELAQRMAKVGNWSKLNQAREQVFYAEAMAQLAGARQNALVSRERLTRLLGLWGSNAQYKLPDRLPDLPIAPDAPIDIESRAMGQRLDVQMAKRDTEATASALGLTRATGFINVFDAGYANKSVTGQPRENGYQISLELPIFDWGGARTVKAQSMYMQAVYRTADTAVRARSEVREAYGAYRTNYDVAKHYMEEVVPLRKKISDEVMLRYNGMLASVFELLSDARDQVKA